jgi:transposase-like protein
MSPSARKEAMRERRAHWRRIFEEAAQSQLSIRRFCQEHKVDETQFYYWRRVLAGEEGTGESEQAARFVLVRPEAQQPPESEETALELLVDRGWRLRIRPGVDEATLGCVLMVLARPA